MRIGIIGRAELDDFAWHLADAARQLGHEPLALPLTLPRGPLSRAAYLARQAWPGLDERIQRRVVRAALDGGCDVVICVDLRLAPAGVAALRAAGVKAAFWFPDHVANLGRQYMLLAPYDAVFLKDPHLVRALSAFAAAPVSYLPEACNPRIHRPDEVAVASDPYLVVAGNMYPSRVRLLERLSAKGIPLALYGAGFPRWLGPTPLTGLHRGEYLLGARKAAVFRGAAGVLNTMHPAEVAGVNARLFEAAGCGAAVLTESRPALADLFTPENELLACSDFDELVGQAERLLGDPALAGRLGDAAAARARRDHTYEHRLTTILARLS